jgi:hypothetical protein
MTKEKASSAIRAAMEAVKSIKGKDSEEYALMFEALVVFEHDLDYGDDVAIGV